MVSTLTLVSAASIGSFPEGNDVTIYQTCNNCTSLNFTRLMNTHNQTLLSNIQSTKDGTFYSTLVLSGNLTELGTYKYCYSAGNTAETQTGCINFDVTFTGIPLTEQMSTVYIISIIFFMFLFILTIISISKLPSKDATDEEGSILHISNLKHLRPVLWGVCWALLLGMLFIISNLTLAYLPSKMLGNIFFAFFKILMWLTIPGLFLWFIWIFTGIFRDKEYKRMMERGVDIKSSF